MWIIQLERICYLKFLSRKKFFNVFISLEKDEQSPRIEKGNIPTKGKDKQFRVSQISVL